MSAQLDFKRIAAEVRQVLESHGFGAMAIETLNFMLYLCSQGDFQAVMAGLSRGGNLFLAGSDRTAVVSFNTKHTEESAALAEIMRRTGGDAFLDLVLHMLPLVRQNFPDDPAPCNCPACQANRSQSNSSNSRSTH